MKRFKSYAWGSGLSCSYCITGSNITDNMWSLRARINRCNTWFYHWNRLCNGKGGKQK